MVAWLFSCLLAVGWRLVVGCGCWDWFVLRRVDWLTMLLSVFHWLPGCLVAGCVCSIACCWERDLILISWSDCLGLVRASWDRLVVGPWLALWG